MCDAIEELRPSLVIWENVRGALSADAESNVEPCPLCVGDEPGTVLRALGRVLGDLSELGFDAEWVTVRASDVGACHQRARVFVVAWPADTESVGWDWRGTARAGRDGLTYSGGPAVVTLPTPVVKNNENRQSEGYVPNLGGALKTLPTPRASDGDHGGPNQRGSRGDLTIASAVAMLPTPRATRGGSTTETLALLPTPAVNDMGAGKDVDAWDDWTDDMRAKHGNGNGHGKSLSIEVLRQSEKVIENVDQCGCKAFGDYAPAVHRTEQVLGRSAPRPTLPTGREGKAQLNVHLVEFMMMLPDGWVTDPAIWEGVKGARNQQVKMFGNGIVPAQLAEAVRTCMERTTPTAITGEGVAA